VKWLGFDWEDRLYYASGYYEKLYQYALALIRKGKAYICDLSADEIREFRGTLTEPGKESPFRNRSIEENLDLFGRIAVRGVRGRGACPACEDRHVLSQCYDARSDHVPDQEGDHYRTGDAWCIYPMYDFATASPTSSRDHPFNLHAGVRE